MGNVSGQSHTFTWKVEKLFKEGELRNVDNDYLFQMNWSDLLNIGIRWAQSRSVDGIVLFPIFVNSLEDPKVFRRFFRSDTGTYSFIRTPAKRSISRLYLMWVSHTHAQRLAHIFQSSAVLRDAFRRGSKILFETRMSWLGMAKKKKKKSFEMTWNFFFFFFFFFF